MGRTSRDTLPSGPMPIVANVPEPSCSVRRAVKSRGLPSTVAIFTTAAPQRRAWRIFRRRTARDGVFLKSWNERMSRTRWRLADASTLRMRGTLRSSISTKSADGKNRSRIWAREALPSLPAPPSSGCRAVRMIGSLIFRTSVPSRSKFPARQSRRISTRSIPQPVRSDTAWRTPRSVCAVATTRHCRGVRFLLCFMQVFTLHKRRMLTPPTRTAVPIAPRS